MSPNPEGFLAHLRSEGYHSRSDKHSNSLANAIVVDLVRHCPLVARRAAEGRLVYDLNVTIYAGNAEWNSDLVLGEPALDLQAPPPDLPISRAKPSHIQIAIELKSIMTEHRKAVKNRKRDLEAHHEHVHNYNNMTIAAGVFVINAAPVFKSPLRNDASTHRNPAKLVEHCVAQLRSVSARGGSTGYGLEAKCAVVVDMDNVELPATRYLSTPPAPAVSDPLHYDAFIRAICEHYTRRFA